MDVDSVEQRARNSRPVSLYLRGSACAFSAGVTQIAAFAGVHRRDEHKFAGVGYFACRAGNCQLAVLHWLPEVVENRAEFRKLVEEQNPIVRERHFAGARIWAASCEPYAADCVVRRPEWASKKFVFRELRKPRRGIYAENFEKFVERRQRHY